MVVEHIFVTTRDWPDVMSIVSDLLTPDGFTVDPVQAFSIDGAAQPMGLTRGKKAVKTRKLKPVLTPSRLRMMFDRGRLNLAVSLEDRYSGGGFRLSRYGGGAPKKVRAGREKYLITLAQIIQALATGYIEPAAAAAQHAAAEDEVRQLNRRMRNRSLITLGIIFAAVFGIIVLAAILGSSH